MLQRRERSYLQLSGLGHRLKCGNVTAFGFFTLASLTVISSPLKWLLVSLTMRRLLVECSSLGDLQKQCLSRCREIFSPCRWEGRHFPWIMTSWVFYKRQFCILCNFFGLFTRLIVLSTFIFPPYFKFYTLWILIIRFCLFMINFDEVQGPRTVMFWRPFIFCPISKSIKSKTLFRYTETRFKCTVLLI